MVFQQELQAFLQPEHGIRVEDTVIWRYARLAQCCYEETVGPGCLETACGGERMLHRAEGNRELWLAWPGSTQMAHWIGESGNMKASVCPWPLDQPVRGGIHAGYAEALKDMADSLTMHVVKANKPQVLRLTGHSRGAALATLAGLFLAKVFPALEIRVVVFGAPRIGDADFAQAYRKQENLKWAGFLHEQDVVGLLPPWLCHIRHPIEPATSFQTRLLASLVESHSMEGYLTSLRCDYMLRLGTPAEAQQLLDGIRDPSLKSALAVSLRAHSESSAAVLQEVQQMQRRLGEVYREEHCRLKAEEVVGTLHFLESSGGQADTIKSKLMDVEGKLYHLAVHAASELSSETRAKLLDFVLQAAIGWIVRLAEVGLEAEIRWKLLGLAQRLRSPFWQLAEALPHGEFFQAVPSLQKFEAFHVKHTQLSEPLILGEELRIRLLPKHLRDMTCRSMEIRTFFRDLSLEQAHGGGVQLWSQGDLGSRLIGMLEHIIQEAECDDPDVEQYLNVAYAEVHSLQDRLEALEGLPEVVVTGPTNSGKSSLVNALLGRDLTSATAVPDSLFPVRLMPHEGSHYRLKFDGSCADKFVSNLDSTLQACLAPGEMTNEQEVEEKIHLINSKMRAFLNSEAFQQVFHVSDGWLQICADWCLLVEVPVGCRNLPFTLVDLPGNSEGGVAGEFINAMIKGSCRRAIAALFTVSPDHLTELEEKGSVGPRQRYFAGVETFGGDFVLMTKVASKKMERELRPELEKHARTLEPPPLAVKFVNSFLLRAHGLKEAGPLPSEFSPRGDAAEQERCRAAFRGARGQDLEDEEDFDGRRIEEELVRKFAAFPDSGSFPRFLSAFVESHLPAMILEPTLRKIRENLAAARSRLEDRMRSFRKTLEQRQREMETCQVLLSQSQDDPRLLLSVSCEETVSGIVERRIGATISKAAKLLSTSAKQLSSSDLNRAFNSEVVDLFQRHVIKGKRTRFNALEAKSFTEKIMRSMAADVVLDALVAGLRQSPSASTSP